MPILIGSLVYIKIEILHNQVNNINAILLICPEANLTNK